MYFSILLLEGYEGCELVELLFKQFIHPLEVYCIYILRWHLIAFTEKLIYEIDNFGLFEVGFSKVFNQLLILNQ